MLLYKHDLLFARWVSKGLEPLAEIALARIQLREEKMRNNKLRNQTVALWALVSSILVVNISISGADVLNVAALVLSFAAMTAYALQ